MSQSLRAPRLVAQAPSAIVRFEICRGADWNDCFQLRERGVPIDLTGRGIEIVIRPAYESDTLYAALSTGAGDLLLDDAETGKVQIYYPASKVDDFLPAGGWTHVARITDDGEFREIWRGPIIVLPARYE